MDSIKNVPVIRENDTIDTILAKYKKVLGKDFTAYHHHVYRIFNFALLQDSNTENIEKYAIAAAFHDIAIWTHHTFDYLSPSIQLAVDYLTENGKSAQITAISLMIDLHHKMSAYTGEFSTVETFRKADWIDVSIGFMTFGLDKKALKEIKKIFPYHGFHLFLVKQTMKNMVKQPLNPLPMFKR